MDSAGFFCEAPPYILGVGHDVMHSAQPHGLHLGRHGHVGGQHGGGGARGINTCGDLA